MLKQFENNNLGQDYVVGDIHGDFARLQVLLKKIEFNFDEDRLFSVGDLIDRGPESQKCLDLINEAWFNAVRGNHEDMLIKAFQDPERWSEQWMRNGGTWSQALDQETLGAYAERLSKLPLAISVGEGETRFNVFHAEFFGNDESLDKSDYSDPVREQILWGRSLVRDASKKDLHSGLSKSFCGHTPLQKPAKIGSHIYLDTGCGYPNKLGKLTIVNPAAMRFYSV